MRYVFAVWAIPLIIFWGWFGLSYYDINFGYLMLSRQVHDLYFQIAGQMTGLEPNAVPLYIAKLFAFDAVLLAAIWAFRRRREIRAWVRQKREGYSTPRPGSSAGSLPSV